MKDPTFATRAKLTTWMAAQLVGANSLPPQRQLALLGKVRRVVEAHIHLPFEEPTQ